jgi:hypothetical protein
VAAIEAGVDGAAPAPAMVVTLLLASPDFQRR